jgi:hypothetical protein
MEELSVPENRILLHSAGISFSLFSKNGSKTKKVRKVIIAPLPQDIQGALKEGELSYDVDAEKELLVRILARSDKNFEVEEAREPLPPIDVSQASNLDEALLDEEELEDEYEEEVVRDQVERGITWGSEGTTSWRDLEKKSK